jgi:Domain of unknown function (DUF5665)
METSQDPNQELNTNIVELSATIKKVNSLKFIFLRGIANGVGTFIGATIVAAIVITLLVQVLNTLDIDLGIRDYLNSLVPKIK